MRWLALMVLLAAGCSQHEPGRVEVQNSQCVFCHQADYEIAETPPHAGVLPAEVCAECHETTAWSPAIFSHDKVRATCATCHLPDYQQTADPIHEGMFPQTCQDCHVTTAWRPALEGIHPENNFPITRGPHENTGCTECHDPTRGSSIDGMNTMCTACHTQSNTPRHEEVPDYRYDSGTPNFCLECHPNGSADGD